jgi:hypothetical protein
MERKPFLGGRNEEKGLEPAVLAIIAGVCWLFLFFGNLLATTLVA